MSYPESNLQDALASVRHLAGEWGAGSAAQIGLATQANRSLIQRYTPAIISPYRLGILVA
jgi:hypothetical protein